MKRHSAISNQRSAVDSRKLNAESYIPLFTALFFAAHPVQTEAVTYILQRTASLAALFYLLSLVLYARWRGSRTPFSRVFYAGSLLSAFLAMNTKESALTLPFAVLLYESFFFVGPFGKRVLSTLPFFPLLIVFPINLMLSGLPVGNIFLGIDGAVDTSSLGIDSGLFTTPVCSRGEYLITQFRVIVSYLRLLFYPAKQNLIYDYPIYTSLWQGGPLLSLLFLLSILGFGVWCLRSARRIPALRLIAFGIFWFFLNLAVESSVFPLPMIIHEYRLYLPSMGIFLAVLTGAGMFAGRTKGAGAALLCAGLLLSAGLAVATYERNKVWRDEVSLWEDVVRKSPLKSKPHNNLGLAYQGRGLTGRAAVQYAAAIALDPGNYRAYNNLGGLYLSEKLYSKAIEQYTEAINIKPDYAEAHYNLGIAYAQTGRDDMAEKYYLKAVMLRPSLGSAHYNLGVIYAKRGLTDRAASELEEALRYDPGHRKARALLNLLRQ